MIKLKPITVARPSERLAETLQEQIIGGAIAQGQMLNEQEIVGSSGLSRNSVREALRMLETRGLVETRRGRYGGWMVRSSGVEPVARSLDIYVRSGHAGTDKLLEIAEIVEPGLAALAAERRTEDDLADLRKALDELGAADGSDQFVELNRAWHLALVRASHNEVLIALYESLGPELLNPDVDEFVTPEIRAAVLLAADRIFAALVEGDAEAARRRMTKHVQAYRRAIEAAHGA